MRDRNAPLTPGDLDRLDWAKMDGLLPALVQDASTLQALMLGYMDRAALEATLRDGFATFYSRSKQRLWQKGETSGNRLAVKAVLADCDADALLVLAVPAGPTCHLGTASCFGEETAPGLGWLGQLARIVDHRSAADPQESYTARLLDEGPVRIAQKIGEEGVELALAGAAGDRDACIAEAADLVFHMTVLMQSRGFGWEDLTEELRRRHGQ
ncbi:bifunctional phosphoribosyl-AMP cyclohydrolase/phosphoribosyl-ATP diphosphatase HisIE [Sphingosinicella sp. CPCC 101087]|uniref:bifunctional phosphoribosyl-AMP cyclohydrolase/phosphoribosyl-ATP diphosphatase HisIE n=1 Tax=Sphingosinicella sp. CPCC 101087 TaxID=2497754 RepID=UPI00101D9E00|nr:bifunctional phosphoribosyl-AMP cyclohydrolase/phosphoribosyl-ATP diphosphatase HisIE [Sphingosinicella sp. CPCC 101087]